MFVLRGPSSSILLLRRLYVTRAHPKPIPEIAVTRALKDLLAEAKQRGEKREKKLIRNGKQVTGFFDETVELALNLNLDPRKPGQSLRGSVDLPNGTGKKINCIVFTSDEDLQEQCRKVGATAVGGVSLIEKLVSGGAGTDPTTDGEPLPSIDTLDRALATPELMPTLSKKAARLLGPRGLMPNAKNNTLVSDPALLVPTLENQILGKNVLYRTEKSGIVHVPVGKVSFGIPKLLENIGVVMKEVFEAKPEQYGKGKKSGKTVGKGTKYLLRASLTTTQGVGVRLDLKTVDPSSALFLSSEEEKLATGKSEETRMEDVAAV